MKLLSKREVTTAKQRDRELDIQQAVVLARKVDTLRETHAEEERSLEDFRVKTVAAIHEELSLEGKKLTDLKREMAEAESRKAEALKPLTAEREALNRTKEELETQKGSQDKREALLDSRDVESKQLQDEAIRLTVAAASNRENAEIMLMSATRDRDKALEMLADARQIVESANELQESVDSNIQKREQALYAREESVRIIEERQSQREQAVIDRERAVEDKYNTLLRAQTYGERRKR